MKPSKDTILQPTSDNVYPESDNNQQQLGGKKDSCAYPTTNVIYYICQPQSPVSPPVHQWIEDRIGSERPFNYEAYFFTPSFDQFEKVVGEISERVPFEHLIKMYENSFFTCDADGDIQQLRPGNLKNYQGEPVKYLTISPRRFKDDAWGNTVKPIFVSSKPNAPSSTLIITEGLTKAFAASLLGFDAISLAGVTMWRSDICKRWLRERAEEYQKVVICFDADLSSNGDVMREVTLMGKEFGFSFFDINVYIAELKRLQPDVCKLTPDDYKGLDDLFRNLDPILRRSLVMSIESSSPAEDLSYFIKDYMRPYQQMVETIRANFPTLYFDGRWVNEYRVVKSYQVDNWIKVELAKFYSLAKSKVSGKTQQEYRWGTNQQEALNYVKGFLQLEATKTLHMQNGFFCGGKFTSTRHTDPRAVRWSRLDSYEPPYEVIDFLNLCHGNMDYRLWLYSLLDNSVPYGGILGVMGKSGSGKSVTLTIAQKLLGELDCKSVPLTRLSTVEAMAGLGSPRLIFQSDCQQLPDDMTMLYSLSDGAEIDVRPLYQTTFESRRFFSRIAFGCVNLPSVNFTSGGFDRRFKAIQCTAFEGIEGVVGKMLACLEDDTYIERLANWVMDTDREQSLAFMDVSTAVTGVAESARHTMEYQWVDRALTYDSENGCADVTVDDFYQMFMAYCHRNGRSRVTTQTRFTNMIESFGVPVVRGKAERINGKIVTSQDTIGSDNNSGEPIYIDKSLVCVFERSGLIPTSIPHNQFFAQRELVEETIDRP